MSTDVARQPSAFGQLMKQGRLACALTQEELAERSGVSARLISDLERGVIQRPRADTAAMVADALGLAGAERERLLAARRAPAGGLVPDPSDRPAVVRPALVGREHELAALVDLLVHRGCRLVTITGPGGVGKTTLAEAVRADDRVRAAMPSTAMVELAQVRDDSVLLPAIAEALGIAETGSDVLTAIAGKIVYGPALLLLDNLEHLPAAADGVARLLAAAPGLAILATSREPLRLRDEAEYPLAPLPVPAPRHLPPLAELATIPAVALLVQRAAAARPAFALTEANAPAIAEIVTRLDGLPLAIELAAARLRSLAPGDLAARLEHRLPLLTHGPRDLPDRHQTMAAAIDWSYQLLPETERQVFRRFAVFDGGAAVDAAELVCGEGLNADETFDALHALAEKHLIGVVDDEETRYRMLETVREYAQQRLAEAGEEDAARRSHATWWADLLEHIEQKLVGPEQERWFRALTRDHDNVRAALRWSLAANDAATAHALSGGMLRFWMTRGHLQEARRWYEAALALDPDATTPRHASALAGHGVVTCFLGDYGTARRQTERAREIWVALGREREIGSCFGNLGLIADLQGRYDEATVHYEEALRRFRAVGDRGQAGYMLHNLGMIAHDQAGYARAADLFQQALAIQRELGDSASVAHSLSALGQIAFARGAYAEATRLQIEALELREALGDESGIAKCLACLAEIAAATGEAVRAAWLLGAAETIRMAIGSALPPVDQPAHDRTIERARAALGRRAFTHARHGGATAPRERVLAVAVGDEIVTVLSPDSEDTARGAG